MSEPTKLPPRVLLLFSKLFMSSMDQLKAAVQASIRAYALGALGSDDGPFLWTRFDAMVGTLTAATKEALVSVAIQFNSNQLVNKLPPEIFVETMSYLALPDRQRAIAVCSSWRNSLLRAPTLWAHISTSSKVEGDLAHLPAMLAALLARSQQSALTVDLKLSNARSDNGPGIGIDLDFTGFSNRVAEMLIPHMGRMKSLSLILTEWSDTAWATLFATPAPTLETFRLLLDSEEDQTLLPNNLFAYAAPKLHHAYLDWVWMASEPYPALAGLTSLFYDFARGISEDELRLIASWTQLRHLTLVVEEAQSFEDIRFLQHLRLQVWSSRNLDELLDSFPHARHVCYSGGLRNRDLTAAIDAIRERDSVSVEVGHRIPLLPSERDDKTPRFAVRLDGQDVAVDLLQDDLEFVFARILPPLSSFLQGVRRLALIEYIWPMFDLHILPALDELTFYLSPRYGSQWREADFLATDDRQINLSTPLLRIVRVSLDDPHNRAPSRRLAMQPIIRFVATKLRPGALQQLVLCGFKTSRDDLQMLSDVGIQNVAFERAPAFLDNDDDYGPWRWAFPAEDALLV